MLLPAASFSQLDRQKVGNESFFNQQGGFFNYGDKDKVNIDVNVWGFVKFPGKYLIPEGSTVQDLISYSGGPSVEAKLEEIILFRPKNDSLGNFKDEIFSVTYNDLFWEELKHKKDRINPILKPGDILILKGEPRYFARDNVNFILSISAVLISLGILVVTAISVGKQ
ncbi:MAG: hypothetical protein HGGPFJEG_01264 [Ignavibacteria bacterium]|nr:hypothetical protein [Ignavibacteria bacterium]